MAAETAELDKITHGMEVIEGPQGMALVTNDLILHARFQPELTDAEMPNGAPSVEEAKTFNQDASEIKKRRRVLAWAGVLASPVAIAAPASGSGNEKLVENIDSVLPRSTEDRPDDLAGRQIHVVYAVPSDGGNLNSDTDGNINQTLANVDNYAENRGMPGMRWRWDLYQGQPDITHFQFNKTGAELSQMAEAEQKGAFLDYANSEIKRTGLNNNPQKVYLILYEGTAEMPFCDDSERWPTVFIGGPAAQDNSTLAYFKETGCINSLTPGITSGLLRIIGFPTNSAPHSNKEGSVTDDSRDLLWVDAWKPGWSYRDSILDPGHDDYLMTGRRDDLTRVNYVTFPLNITEGGENGNVIYLPGGVVSGAAAPLKPDPGNRFPGGTEITLKAEGQFVRWGGDCAQETDDTCELLMDRPHSVTAFFKEAVIKAKTIKVAIKKKLGNGVVTGSGVKCPKDCTTSLQKGKELALTAKPNRISRAVWIGGCARKIGNKCIVNYGTTDAPKTATVVFSRK